MSLNGSVSQWSVQGVPRPSTNADWDRLQPHLTLLDKQFVDNWWMERRLLILCHLDKVNAESPLSSFCRKQSN